MINIFKKSRIVDNFPENYPLYKKVIANIAVFVSDIIIRQRKNELTKKELADAQLKLKKGDVVLTGNLRILFHSFVREPLTHSEFYIGKNKFVHSTAEGVSYMSIYEVFEDYDTLVILRMPKNIKHRKRMIHKAVKFAKRQLGKPYDFEFQSDKETFFCTQLVNEAFAHAGYETGLVSAKPSDGLLEKIEGQVTGVMNALQPIQFLEGKFDIIYMSENLKYKDGKLLYVPKEQ